MSVRIEPELPSYFGNKASPELADLAGASIVRIGVPAGGKIPSAKFGIEYRRSGRDNTEIILFGFNDTGLWIENVKRAR